MRHNLNYYRSHPTHHWPRLIDHSAFEPVLISEPYPHLDSVLQLVLWRRGCQQKDRLLSEVQPFIVDTVR